MDQNFLSERKQKVVLNGSNSKWTDATSGIPQGSVLGPILFTIYINDLPDVVQNVAKLFADDTKLYAAVNNTNDEIKLQGDILSTTTKKHRRITTKGWIIAPVSFTKT